MSTIILDKNTFLTFTRHTIYAASRRDSRPEIAGALIKAREKELMMIATDGHRMAIIGKHWQALASQTPTEIFVPLWILEEARKVLNQTKDNAEVQIEETDFAVCINLREKIKNFCDAKVKKPFPNWQYVTTSYQPHTIAIVERKMLIETLRNVRANCSILAARKGVRIKIESQVTLEMLNNKASLPSKTSSGLGECLVDVFYLKQALQALSPAKEIALSFSESGKVVMLRTENEMHLIAGMEH